MGLKYSSRTATEFYSSYPNGSRSYRTADPFASVARVENCPCEDGGRRTAFATAEADTFFSVPACTYVGKKTVGGFLTFDEEGWRFVVTMEGKNAHLIAPRGGPK